MTIHDPSRIEDRETWNHATINQFLMAFWKGQKFPFCSANLEEVQVSFPANSLKRSTPWFHFLGFICLPVFCLSWSCVCDSTLVSASVTAHGHDFLLNNDGSLVQAKNDYGLFTLPAYPLEPRLQCWLLWMIISNSSKDSCSSPYDLQVRKLQ